jgi:SAM-dependent methyltransferase
MQLEAARIEVSESEPLPLMIDVEQAYVERFGPDPDDLGGWYDRDAWKRVSRVFEILDKGGDVLDVGSGAGQFANCLALSGEFQSVTTIDPTLFNKYLEVSDQVRRMSMSADDLEFPDDSFDVVVCMEVLEHVSDQVLRAAITEMRRVCRGQLVITVPYREPEPMTKTHVRRFDNPDFLELFPRAEFVILRRRERPWMLVEERPNVTVSPRMVALRERVDELTRENQALKDSLHRLRNRRSVRAADWLGGRLRQLRGPTL